jgi:phosphatidate cytidylyltransferase
MLKHRLIAGSMMAAALLAILFGDAVLSDWLNSPIYPFLCLFTLIGGYFTTRELVNIIPSGNRPDIWSCTVGVLALFAVQFLPGYLFALPVESRFGPRSWEPVAAVYGLFALFLFLQEMYRYRATGDSVTKIAHGLFVVAYIGLLPSFFIKLRWLTPDGVRSHLPALYLAVAVFVPKFADIAAYFVGRAFGRHKFTPLLSPKKTWEGFAGCFLGSIFAAWLIDWFGTTQQIGTIFRAGWLELIGFGVIVGFVGVLGDLAESMVKRDGQIKDASQTVPGFGGLLDVFDSVIFAAPVVYLWLTVQHASLATR